MKKKMLNYELQVKLNNLTLSGQNEDGELEWIGTNEEWTAVETYLREREQVVKDIEWKYRIGNLLDGSKLTSNSR